MNSGDAVIPGIADLRRIPKTESSIGSSKARPVAAVTAAVGGFGKLALLRLVGIRAARRFDRAEARDERVQRGVLKLWSDSGNRCNDS